MPNINCPGQSMRFWKPEDICYVSCPFCSEEIEFWKDEPYRICAGCKKNIRNPRMNLGCAEWCKHGDQCIGTEND